MKDRYVLGLVGIVIIVLAWITLNADHFPVVYRLIAPEYVHAVTAYGKMQKEGLVLKKRDPGFSEMSEVLKILMGKDRNLEMTRIKVAGKGQGPTIRPEGIRWIGYIDLEISFLDAPSEIWAVGDLQAAIKKRFLTLNVFLWSSLLFGIGIVLLIAAIFVQE